jgi:SNF2 family DNA or RNA helicase
VISLTAVRILKYERFQANKVLVIAPKKVAEGTWSTEARKWDHLQDLRISTILGAEKQRIAAAETTADVYVVNRENVVWLKDLYRNDWPFDMVIVDEASSFKSHTAKRFKALAAENGHIRRMVLLTGTPTPNGLLDLWSQIYLLDGGERLQKRYTWYRDIYFEPDVRGAYGQVFSYRPKKGSEETILKKVSDICISMKAEDYLSLPDMIFDTVPVVLDPKAQKAYQEMEKQMVLQLDEADEITALSAATLTTKLLQLSNGAVYDEIRAVHRIHDCKLDALGELIEGLKERGKSALVFYQYQHDMDRILERLNDTPRILACVLDGPDTIEAWNAGEVDVLLAHPASASYGLNLQAGGSHIIWFGLTWNYEQYVQANARLHRQGQTDTVIVHHLVSQGTRDADVMRALEHKDQAQQYVLESLKARIRKVRDDAKR